MAKTLNLEFERVGIVQLQYLPTSLVLSEATRHNTIPTLNGKVSFVAPNGTHSRDLKVSAYFTALLAGDEQENIAALRATAAVALGIGVAQVAGGSQVVSILNSIRQTVALAKGVYDSVAGIISPKAPVSLPIGNLTQAADKLAALIEAERLGDTCYISWDLDKAASPAQTPYILRSLSVQADRLSEDAQTMQFSVALDFIEAGQVINLQ